MAHGTRFTFDPWPWEEVPFDVAVNHGAEPLQVGQYSRLHTICSIYNFKKPDQRNPEEELKVQVIVACNTPMEVILNFHSGESVRILSTTAGTNDSFR